MKSYHGAEIAASGYFLDMVSVSVRLKSGLDQFEITCKFQLETRTFSHFVVILCHRTYAADGIHVNENKIV